MNGTPAPSANKVFSTDPSDHVDDARLPLVIGIVADRGLTPEAAKRAEDSVVGILAGMRGLYRATPFLLLVQWPAMLRSFADGHAGRLAADTVALEDHLALLPGPPGGAQAASLGRDPREETTCRAAFLADHSHLVIAISDSREPAPGGLVDQVIQFRLQGIPDGHTGRPLQLDKAGLGSVQHVIAGNSGGAAADAATSTLMLPQIETLSGDEELDDATAWDHLDRFNANVAGRLRRRPRGPLAHRAWPRAWPSGYAWVRERFAVADALAIEFQQATHATTFGLLVLGLIAALAFQLSGVLPHATLLYTASLVLAHGWYLWAYWRRYEHCFHDYRALAEGLRVQMYWSAAGITACAADYYLRRQRSEFQWIRQVLRAWTVTARLPAGYGRMGEGQYSGTGGSPADAARRHGLRQVCEQWVDDQWNYYRRTALRHQSLERWLSRAGKGFFVLGLLVAGAKPFFPANMALTVALGLAPAVAALLYMYAQTRAFGEQARQYDRMGRLFGSARSRLQQALGEGDADAFQRLLLELGKEALRENGDWVLLHRERPITFGSARSWVLAGAWILGVCFRRRPKEQPRISAESMDRRSRAA